MRRAVKNGLFAAGAFATVFIGGSAVAGALEVPDLTSGLTQSQTGTVSNDTTQSSKAKVDNDQSNVYVPISVLSPSAGDNEVHQGNSANNSADSAAVNGTAQGAHQSQDGTATSSSEDGGWGDWWMSGGQAASPVADVDQSQTGTVDNTTDQTSKAKVDNHQTNVYVPISVLSPSAGDNEVHQGNSASNSADSAAVNGTAQGAHQSQDGAATSSSEDRCSDWNTGPWVPFQTGEDEGGQDHAAVDQSQTGTVDDATDQTSKAEVDNDQDNTYIPVSFLSPTAGDDHVVQGNSANNTAESHVANGTIQGLHQDQDGTATSSSEDNGSDWNTGPWVPLLTGGDEGGQDHAAVDQSQTGTVKNHTEQDSKAKVDNEQGNTAFPIVLASPSAGDSSIRQGNAASNHAESWALNGTAQGLWQNQHGAATSMSEGHGATWHPCGWEQQPIR